MAREIRDEKQMEASGAARPNPAPPASPTIQIQISDSMQKQLVDIVLEDWNASKTARGKKDYGIDSKGSALDFDKWLKGLRDLYNARREPKDVPWKYCSNRGLRISTSILDMIHSRLFPSVVNEELLRWRPG